MSIWEELVDRHGLTSRYAAVQRFVRGMRDAMPPEAHVVIATRPGEEAQVDSATGRWCAIR
jgi:transposase